MILNFYRVKYFQLPCQNYFKCLLAPHQNYRKNFLRPKMDLSNVLKDIPLTYPKRRKGKKVNVSSVSSGNISEDEEESEHDFSDEEFSAQVFEDAPDWAEAMIEYLKHFILKMTSSNKALSSKLNKLGSEFQEFKREKDNE